MAADYFLKLDPKVEGESPDSKHKGEIELESWSFGVSNNSSALHGGGVGAGKSMPSGPHVTKKTDKASRAPRAGRGHGRALQVGHSHRAQGRRHTAGVPDDHAERRVHLVVSVPADRAAATCRWSSCRLNFAKIVQEYKEQKPDGTLGGSVKLGYDLSKQVKI